MIAVLALTLLLLLATGAWWFTAHEVHRAPPEESLWHTRSDRWLDR